jgi:hypothetical protein
MESNVISFPRSGEHGRATLNALTTTAERIAWADYVAAMAEFDGSPCHRTAGALIRTAVAFETIWIGNDLARDLSIFDTVAKIAACVEHRGIKMAPLGIEPITNALRSVGKAAP